MYYTLSQLRDSINQKIIEEGEGAPVAAFIFTSQDVTENLARYELNANSSIRAIDCSEITCSDGVIQQVLMGIGDSDYIYEMIEDKIQIQITEVKENTAPVA